MTTIASRLQAVRARIDAAASAAGREARDIALVAVSKTFPPSAITEAYAAGQTAFGENYVQEAVDKMRALSRLLEGPVASPQAGPLLRPLEWQAASAHRHDDKSSGGPHPSSGVASPQAGPLLRPLEWQAASAHRHDDKSGGDPHPSSGVASPQAGPLLRPLEWHFIGPIQSNKTKAIAENFDWVHSIDRAKIAERLSQARPKELPPLQVCIQVNVGGEATKSGVAPHEVLALAQAVAQLPRLQLRGLMAIPAPTADPVLQHSGFRTLREIKDEIVRRGIALDTLSMGMSDDLEAAIAEGATIVRIGRAIFGSRSRMP